jgi:bifunctional DNA-binding transcriptional regulator/antitoxin component of YhaV-PrlF toxin-antitoxin module
MLQDIAVQIDDQGHILIPRDLRQRLRLTAGMTFVVEEGGHGDVRLSPQTEQPALVEEDGILVATGELIGDVTDIVQQDRARRIRALLRQAIP